MLRARANGETFVSATMCPQQCVLVCQHLAGYANHRYTGHATMSTERANDRLITGHAPAFLVLAIAGNQKMP